MVQTNTGHSLNNSGLTPATAMLAELVRRYWVLGMECSLLEIQKLAWFLERAIEQFSADKNPLNLKFVAHKYGPYANRLDHLLNSLDGSYLHCDKRISDADPLDVIWFDDGRKTYVQTYLNTEATEYAQALEYKPKFRVLMESVVEILQDTIASIDFWQNPDKQKRVRGLIKTEISKTGIEELK